LSVAAPLRPAATTGREARWRFVLATDLDGTFLAGSPQQRSALYGWLAERRDEVGLVFVTGRDPAFIEALCAGAVEEAGPVPVPDYVVADVGTTIGRVEQTAGRPTVAVMAELEAPIARAWGDRSAAVRAALDGAPGLVAQDTPFRHRMSYHLTPAAFDPRTTAPLERSGLDILVSAGRFLDVLPAGVNKGSSLLALIDHLAIPRERVLVAGDTLNDLAMFHTGLAGAVVGGAEPDLLEATRALPRARHCTAPGTGGIMEAIAAFALHPEPPEGRP